MKTAIRIIAAGLAASLALESCNKQEIFDGGNTDSVDEVRTIAVSFAKSSVKSAIGEDGLTPKFVAGDVIRLSNGNATEDCTVTVKGEVASISTSLSGTLTAVYPSAAAKMNGNAIAGILVPAVQDGTFANTNICKATIAQGATSVTFANETALFKVTPPSDVKQFTITSLKPIIDSVARTGTAVAINTEGADDAAKLVITVGGPSSELTTFYVSLAAGVNLTDLSFEYTTDETHGAMKGIPMKSIKENQLVDKTAAGTLYTVDSNNWHEYVVLNDKKWATMNVGATTATGTTSYGEYFMWGAVEKAYSSVDLSKDSYAFTFLSQKPATYVNSSTWAPTSGFAIKNAPYSNGSSYTKYNNSDGKTTLELNDDAAYFNWGGSWRMPTSTEFTALFSNSKTWGSNGYTFGTTPNTVYLPAANYGNGRSYVKTAYVCRYMSSTLYSSNKTQAYNLNYYYNGKGGAAQNQDRTYGTPVRPISE